MSGHGSVLANACLRHGSIQGISRCLKKRRSRTSRAGSVLDATFEATVLRRARIVELYDE